MKIEREFYRLNAPFKGLPVGTVLLKGGYQANSDGEFEGNQEYFDLTTEIRTGISYSYYDLPEGILSDTSEDEARYFGNEFDAYYEGNYKPNPSFDANR